MTRRVAIIPARGGSQRIPRKNIRPFLGVPMLAYPIACAQQSGLFDEIIVSTDDEEIAAVAQRYGASTPFIRPADLSDDLTGSDAVVAHALRFMEEVDVMPDEVCCIYATTPLLTSSDLIQSNDLFVSGTAMVMAGVQYPAPIQRALRYTQEMGVEPFFSRWINCRSQDLEPAWMDAGQFYWATPEYYLKPLPVYSPSVKIYPMSKMQVIDIDNDEDWKMAEFFYQYRRSETVYK